MMNCSSILIIFSSTDSFGDTHGTRHDAKKNRLSVIAMSR